jgi:hypothetical protein
VELIDRRARVRRERDVKPALHGTTTSNIELRQPIATEARALPAVVAIDVNQSLEPEGCQCGRVKRAAQREVVDGEVNMIQHFDWLECPSSTSAASHP